MSKVFNLKGLVTIMQTTYTLLQLPSLGKKVAVLDYVQPSPQGKVSVMLCESVVVTCTGSTQGNTVYCLCRQYVSGIRRHLCQCWLHS